MNYISRFSYVEQLLTYFQILLINSMQYKFELQRFFFFLFFLSFFLFRATMYLQHMEVPQARGRTGAAAAGLLLHRATWDLSHICDLLQSLWQCYFLTYWARLGIQPISSWALCRVLNPLSHNKNSAKVFI